MVQESLLLCVKHQLLRVEFAALPVHLSLCGVQQHVFFAERKKIRAFPHFTRIYWIIRRLAISVPTRQGMQILPVQQIRRPVQGDTRPPSHECLSPIPRYQELPARHGQGSRNPVMRESLGGRRSGWECFCQVRKLRINRS